jgi:hypothetical protein
MPQHQHGLLDLTQCPIQWVPENVASGVKWPGCKADNLPPSSEGASNICRQRATTIIISCFTDRVCKNQSSVLNVV